MRKILMFVETFAVIFVLAACGNGVQKKTPENILLRKWNRPVR